MDIEELAARIYASNYVAPKDRGSVFHVTAKQAFRAADHFLKEAARQLDVNKTAPSKPACEHRWYYTGPNENDYRCLRCNEKKLKPPKPERVAAREWWIELPPDGQPRFIFESLDPKKLNPFIVNVREILPGDE